MFNLNADQRAWQPSATIAALQTRAQIIARIRAFFAARKVLEVETPQMSLASGTAVHLAPMQVLLRPNDLKGQQAWLQTSPEFAMKRLLVAGSGPIYQICKAYRSEESGRYHNPEFTMLEWYQNDYSLEQMSAETVALVQEILPHETVTRFTYRDAFLEYVGVDPFTASMAELSKLAQQFRPAAAETDPRDELLDLLLSHIIEPALQAKGIVVIYDYPASQAELAKIRPGTSAVEPAVAERFEVFVRGIELANGYFELTDATEQQQRFAKDLAKRGELGLVDLPVDYALLNALQQGLPTCSGVALGVDRLVMLATNAGTIGDVISFVFDRS